MSTTQSACLMVSSSCSTTMSVLPRSLVQADARLVEDVEDADEPGADLGGQADALRLAAGQRARRAVEGEVVQPDVDEELQPLVDLLEHPLGDLPLARAELEPAQELRALADGHRRDLGDRAVAERDGEADGLEPCTVARGARHLAHVALEPLAAGVGVGLGVAALDVRDHALERRVIAALAAVAVLVAHVHLAAVPLQDRLARLGRQRLPGVVEGEAELLAQRTEQTLEVVADVARRPRADRALGEGHARVGDDQLGVDLHARAEAGALGAGAERRVEREGPRLELLERQVVVEAGQVLGEHPLAVRVVVGEVDEVERDQAAGELERGLDRVGEPALGVGLHGQAVDDHLDRVLLLLLERRRLGDRVHHPVDPGAAEALRLELAEQVGVLPLALAHDGREQLEAAAGLELEDAVDDLLRGLAGDVAAADRAVRTPGAGVEQAEVVVDLGDGAHGGARVAVGRLLVDRDRGREALDEVDVRLVHLPEELAGVRGEALDVAALALGEDRVERQRRLARPGQPGEDDHRVAREVERDVLEVVLSGATDDEAIGHGCFLLLRVGIRRGRGGAAPTGAQANHHHRQSHSHRRGSRGRRTV
jgi:hypothetical protein